MWISVPYNPTHFPYGIFISVKEYVNNFTEMDPNLKWIEASNHSHHPGVKKCEIYSWAKTFCTWKLSGCFCFLFSFRSETMQLRNGIFFRCVCECVCVRHCRFPLFCLGCRRYSCESAVTLAKGRLRLSVWNVCWVPDGVWMWKGGCGSSQRFERQTNLQANVSIDGCFLATHPAQQGSALCPAWSLLTNVFRD